MDLDTCNKIINSYVTDEEKIYLPDEVAREFSVWEFMCPIKIDYTKPDNFHIFTKKLFLNKKMWEKFRDRLSFESNFDESDPEFIAWLFSDYTRFCMNFARWLGFNSTIYYFGYDPDCFGTGKICKLEVDKHSCTSCDQTGQIQKAWVKVVNECRVIKGKSNG